MTMPFVAIGKPARTLPCTLFRVLADVDPNFRAVTMARSKGTAQDAGSPVGWGFPSLSFARLQIRRMNLVGPYPSQFMQD
jgi:hypothetical protein